MLNLIYYIYYRSYLQKNKNHKNKKLSKDNKPIIKKKIKLNKLVIFSILLCHLLNQKLIIN